MFGQKLRDFKSDRIKANQPARFLAAAPASFEFFLQIILDLRSKQKSHWSVRSCQEKFYVSLSFAVAAKMKKTMLILQTAKDVKALKLIKNFECHFLNNPVQI